jgi:hypothetical protein
MNLIRTLFFLTFTFLLNSLKSQQITKLEEIHFNASHVIIQDFIKIQHKNFDKEFDSKNPYTFMVLLADRDKNIFQLLYQTNFEGRIVYFGYSKNLMNWITCENYPNYKLDNCLNVVRPNYLSEENNEIILSCFLKQINNCYN